MAKRVVSKSQYWSAGKESYWYLDNRGNIVWRYWTNSPKDRKNKRANNKFQSEKEAHYYLIYGEVGYEGV